MDIYEILESPDIREDMKQHWNWNREVIESNSTRSKLKYRTDNPRSKDGLRSGMVIFDEVHEYRDWRNINVFTTGLGKKPHPRRLYITTDGDVRGGVLDSLIEKSRKILEGREPDNGFFPFICKLDKPEEVDDPNLWAKANPSLPYLPNLKTEMLLEYADYKENPADAEGFMTKRMNLHVGNKDIEVASWENIVACCREVPDLTGQTCVCGIDFARTTDFIGACLLFRVDGQYYAIHHSWMCENSSDRLRVKAPLNEWIDQGLLTLVDDVEVHPSLIASWIWEMAGRYSIAKVAIDSYRHTLVMRELEEIGYSAKEKSLKLTRPSDSMLVQPKINSVFVNRSLAWGDDRMMCWYTNNAKLEKAPHGNYTFGKIEPRSRKTDGFMALVAAFAVESEIPEYVEDSIPEAFFF